MQHKLRAGLQTRLLGREVEYHPEIGSTNDLLAQRAREGAEEGLLIVAGVQTAGRGRLGRSWNAPAGSSVLASVLLRPNLAAGEAFAPTMIFGLAIRRAARDYGVAAELKWPNDVLVGGLKLAGILCEVSFAGQDAWVVAGFGVNLNFDPAEYGLGDRATSVMREAGQPVELVPFLGAVLGEAERLYLGWQQGGYEEVWREWRAALGTVGKMVRVEKMPGVVIEGLARDVAADGALIVETAAGDERVVSGVVELLR